MLQIGDQFDHFLIRGHLAQGGMSDIYRAYDLLTRQEVAVKVPDQSQLGDPAQFERFQREMEVTQALEHPALQRGLGTGQYNRTPYLVTELVVGQSLRSLIAAQAPLPPEMAIRLIRQIADGIAYCHTHEIIHRDLKPENILINSQGQPIIVDFGLALTKQAHRVTYANLSVTAGTPEYMAPEQVAGERGDLRSDVYAIGIIFYELLHGRPPFTGDQPLAILAQHLHHTAPRLDQLHPEVSPQLAAVVARCLQRRPDDRYPNLPALLFDLDHLESVDPRPVAPTGPTGGRRAVWQIPWIRAALLSLALLAASIVFALAVQASRGP